MGLNIIIKIKNVLELINKNTFLKLIPLLLIISACSQDASKKLLKEPSVNVYPPAFIHGSIQKIFSDIFFVTGASIYESEDNTVNDQ